MPIDDGQTRVTFLRGDTAGVRSLYLSLWSEDKRLVTCELNTDPRVTERYRAICDRIDSRGQEEEVIQRFNISALLAPEAPCALVSSSAPKFTRRRDGTEGRARRKRSWIFPGTLWCGTGSKAVGYEQLGMFESVDRCCREHDHCLHIIPSFTVNYGVFNPKFFTVSHCDCDQRFRQCLLGVNDTISSMVGYSFFNILRVPCFELKQQKRCTEMYWWGMCKVAKEAPYAIFKSPLLYNTSDVARKYGDNADSNNLTSSEGQHVTKSKQRCNSRDPPRGDTFYRRRTMGKGFTTKLKTAASVHKDDKPLKQVDSHLLWNYKSQEPMGATQAQNTETKRGLKQNIALHNMTDNQRLCRSLKHLDDCKYKIPPLEKKYDLQNMESKTAYNCHCTSRLAVQIEIFKQPSTLPRLLTDFVSQYCFKLPKQKKCHTVLEASLKPLTYFEHLRRWRKETLLWCEIQAMTGKEGFLFVFISDA
ncbi:group 3 secretory phospholipase A2-like [Micropterus dolomieu]|uniref:group 3 secretory phospholipase A2-like n=1 Tax=Micropterus dolomieu TaxID=147949 RepID=UPI001E8E464F|nr:group 3 secretory phospholipase A2-like [Micropterus dolomieu]